MAKRTELAFRRALERLLPAEPADPGILIAVSGGGDSMALLHLLARRAVGRPTTLVVAHLDHAMRRGSAADRRFVEAAAGDLDLPCVSGRRPVEKLRRRDESPEEAARRVRREFLLQAARQKGCRLIATGHTLDDQAETVLFRLLRGAGPAALAGIRERGPGPFLRPLLGLERADLRDFLAAHGLAFREDPSNRNLRYDRNRLRRRVLPLLQREITPGAPRRLVAAADRLREDAECLDRMGAEALQHLAGRGRDGNLLLDAKAWAELPVPLGRRVARGALLQAGADPRRLTARHLNALLELASGPGGKSLDLPGGLRATLKRGRVRLGMGGEA